MKVVNDYNLPKEILLNFVGRVNNYYKEKTNVNNKHILNKKINRTLI